MMGDAHVTAAIEPQPTSNASSLTTGPFNHSLRSRADVSGHKVQKSI